MENTLRVRLTNTERALLDDAAAAVQKKTSTWARDVLLAAAAGDARPPVKKATRKRVK